MCRHPEGAPRPKDPCILLRARMNAGRDHVPPANDIRDIGRAIFRWAVTAANKKMSRLQSAQPVTHRNSRIIDTRERLCFCLCRVPHIWAKPDVGIARGSARVPLPLLLLLLLPFFLSFPKGICCCPLPLPLPFSLPLPLLLGTPRLQPPVS